MIFHNVIILGLGVNDCVKMVLWHCISTVDCDTEVHLTYVYGGQRTYVHTCVLRIFFFDFMIRSCPVGMPFANTRDTAKLACWLTLMITEI